MSQSTKPKIKHTKISLSNFRKCEKCEKDKHDVISMKLWPPIGGPEIKLICGECREGIFEDLWWTRK